MASQQDASSIDLYLYYTRNNLRTLLRIISGEDVQIKTAGQNQLTSRMFYVIARSNRDNVFLLAATAASTADEAVCLKECVNCNNRETENDDAYEDLAEAVESLLPD